MRRKKAEEKTAEKKKGRKGWILGLLGIGLLCLIVNLVTKPGVPAVKPSQSPAEEFTQYLEETVAEQPEGITTVGSEAEAAIIDRVEYTVLEQADNRVTLEITAPDMTVILNQADQNGGTAQDILNMLNGENVPTKTTTLTVDLDENGKMIESQEFVDAMYGGLLTYLDQFVLEAEVLE